MDFKQADPKGLVRESYAMIGISAEECRSIFVDWALSLPLAVNYASALAVLIAHYAQSSPDHPMSLVLQAGLAPLGQARRRGGRASRVPR